MLLVSTTRIIPGRAVPSFLSGRYSAVKVRKKLYVTFAKPDLLILDDFFTTPIENPLNAVDLFEILEAREGRGSTVFASQLEPDRW